MFRWQKELDRLVIPARRVLRLQQAFNRIQVALPGIPSQEATAYLCAFGSGKGVRVAAVLHLHASGRLAVYLNDEGEVADRKAAAVFNEGIAFVESMGFMLDDLHFQNLSPEERETMWKSFPLAGVEEPRGGKEEPYAGKSAGPAVVRNMPLLHSEIARDLSEKEEWLPTSLRRRLRPSAEEIKQRRLKLCEGIGRFLASM